jgi:hypothetical protein
LPRRQVVLPPLLQPAQRGRGQPRCIGAQEGLSCLRAISGRDALKVQPGQQSLATLGAADRGGQERRMKTAPHPPAIPHPRHLHFDGANARLDVPLGERAVPDDGLPALAIASVGILGSQHGHFHCDRWG